MASATVQQDATHRMARHFAHSVGRMFFAVSGVTALGGLAIVLALPAWVSPAGRVTLAAALALYAVLAGLSWRRATREAWDQGGAVFGFSLAALALVGGVAVLLGDGVRSAAIAFAVLLVCVIGVAVLRPLQAWLTTACAALLVVALAAAEASGALPAPPGATPLPAVLAFHLLALGAALGCGRLIGGVQGETIGFAAEREQRFRGLLAMAADGYWEQDADGLITRVAFDIAATGGPMPLQDGVGRAPWELSALGFDPHALDAMRADFERREPFSGLIASWVDGRGRTHWASLAGRPRFDAAGVFTGYWGIVRDVTDELEREHARVGSEARYRELFARSPTPLFLHRRGIVIDANDAGARLLDAASAEACRGIDLLGLYAEGESRERARLRAETLERMPVGQGTAPDEFHLVSLGGRRLTVQGNGVRVEAHGGAATLTFIHDITARAEAEAALRRSQALLSLLFATSPDCITLTDMTTGRYLLVNDAFQRVTGYGEAEAVGRTSTQLRIWHDPAERDALLRQLRASGRVEELPVTFRAKSGAPVRMLVSAAQFEMDGIAHLVINARDMTEPDRVRNENAAILRNASIGIAFTRDRAFVRANPCFERMFGWAEGTLAGESGAVVWPDADAYADVGRTVGPALAAGRAVELEREMRRRDGSLFICRVLAQALDSHDPARGGTIWIAEDVTERRQIEAALAAARDAAEAASKAKSNFLANMSHEIRTPLNGMLGLAQLARDPELPTARRDQYLAQISDSAGSLAAIISDILDLAKIEAGKIRIETVPFDLRETLAALQHGHQPLAGAKGLGFALHVADDVPGWVSGDPVRLRQIVGNFLSNAIKFTEQGGIEVDVTRGDADRIRLAVRDTGPGIDDATRKRLWAPFTQADDSTTRRYGGTGLGLSICRELAALMGGEVGLDSRVGRGSTFWASLPLPPAEAPTDWSDTGDLDPELLRGARVLLVEDNPVNMTVASAMLEQWGIEVVQAGDGRAAIDAVQRARAQGRPIDLVLMDVQMPGMSGHEAARALRAQYDAHALPIIALTAAALVSERDMAIAAGMNDFLTKPIDIGKLREALMRHLAAVA